jgi:hypothetical protein
MAEIDKSMKLVFNEFQRSVTEVPLEVYYQEITSDQYSSSGFQFNVKQPGINALLDSDVWVKYVLYLKTENFQLQDMFNYHEGTVSSGSYIYPNNTSIPDNNYRFALRGGNIVARSLQNLSIQINNSTLVVQPYRFLPVLDRIYVSNTQSEHEFTGSGGRFDEGNHGGRTAHSQWQTCSVDAAGQVGDNTKPMQDANANSVTTKPIHIFIKDSFYPDTIVATSADASSVNVRRPYPLMYEFYNPGFSRRFEQFCHKCRGRYTVGQMGSIAPAKNAPNIDGTNGTNLLYFDGTYPSAASTASYYTIELWERLPIPCFKMYSTDGVFGVIPNIVQMQIQGNFLTNMLNNCFRANKDSANVSLDWSFVAASEGKLYLRWYTPPVNFSVPREISIPYPKIATWSTSLTLSSWTATGQQALEYTINPFSQYNITLESIPDLLLIYVRYSPFRYGLTTPDDYNLELTNLVINIDNASGKLNQIHSMDLYQKWKKIIKHADAHIIGYEEWKRYCCVACLQPEDYGVRFGPGYSNQTTLGITGNALNWHNNPSVFFAANEPLGNLDTGAGTDGELFITSIYNKNRFIIRADGSAGQEMVKIAADFNMLAPASI